MGIKVEFNPDLALRNISEYAQGNRKLEECIPENLEAGNVYDFLKSGQRLFYLSDSEFWSNGQMPLCETGGDENLSRPIASIKILEATHFLDRGDVYTKGRYEVIEVFSDDKVHFEGLRRIK